LLAALHAHRTNPALSITIASKGLLGKSGCTRMVQGGYNVAIGQGDSVERHFMDTIHSGAWLPDQQLVWALVNGAVDRIHELENRYGCFFDRNPDGSLHQKPFAGQTFDRTVHKGDLTGIEIINRLAEQVWRLPITRLEEHRAVDLVRSADGDRIAGVLFIDIRSGEPVWVQARAVLLATGGGPTMYRYHSPSGDKSCDGLALALRAGLSVRDMEMVQFHPTGLLAGSHTRMNGTVLEEGLRGAGGWLKNSTGQRFMHDYDPRGERATRDIVSRGIFAEIRAGRHTPLGGVYLEMGHLGADKVRAQFKGMVDRCADCGFDLAAGRVEVVPTAHYMMGGVRFGTDCRTELPGLYAAGEDTGGVHGANRLGGNGVANSTVFGGIAGEHMARALQADPVVAEPDAQWLAERIAYWRAPLQRQDSGNVALRQKLQDLMWQHVGIFRQQQGLEQAQMQLIDLQGSLGASGSGCSDSAYNLAWQDWLDLENLLLVSQAITQAALLRTNSAGAHFREDYPEKPLAENARFSSLRWDSNKFEVEWLAVDFSIVKPGESLIKEPGT